MVGSAKRRDGEALTDLSCGDSCVITYPFAHVHMYIVGGGDTQPLVANPGRGTINRET
jgi:hypothetical protein